MGIGAGIVAASQPRVVVQQPVVVQRPVVVQQPMYVPAQPVIVQQPVVVQQPAMQQVQVVVPQGVVAGMQFLVAVNGRQYNITCPAGVGPGHAIIVSVPL